MGRIYLDRRDLADFLQLYDPSWSAVLVKLEDYERDKNEVRAELKTTLNEEAFLNPPGESRLARSARGRTSAPSCCEPSRTRRCSWASC